MGFSRRDIRPMTFGSIRRREIHRYTVVRSVRNCVRHPVKVETGPMAVDGIDGRCRGKRGEWLELRSKYQIQPGCGEGVLTRDGTVELVAPGRILRRERGQEKNSFPCLVTASRIGEHSRLIHTLDTFYSRFRSGERQNVIKSK
ncbi:unnamed protein product [Ascophyllum nodosum]